VNHQRDVPQSERLDEGVDVAEVVEEAVIEVGLVGLPHADQVGGDAAADG